MGVLTIVLIIIVVMILFSLFYNIYHSNKSANQAKNAWPPQGSPLICPDYWVNKGNGQCYNPYLIGNGEGGSSKPIALKDFSSITGCSDDPESKECLAAKCRWSHSTNNPWFGIRPNCEKGQNCYCPT